MTALVASGESDLYSLSRFLRIDMDASLESAIDAIAAELKYERTPVLRVLELLESGNTIPFITRYRKDLTGGLDESAIRAIKERSVHHRALQERKTTILKSIDSQGKLTPQLESDIQSASSSKNLEDLYLPYKPKKQTLAIQARQRGLAPLAEEVLEGRGSTEDLAARALDFVRVDKGLGHVDEVMLGVKHLFAESFSERADLRQALRNYLWEHGQLATSRVESNGDSKSEEQAVKSVKRESEPLKPTPQSNKGDESSKVHESKNVDESSKIIPEKPQDASDDSSRSNEPSVQPLEATKPSDEPSSDPTAIPHAESAESLSQDVDKTLETTAATAEGSVDVVKEAATPDVSDQAEAKSSSETTSQEVDPNAKSQVLGETQEPPSEVSDSNPESKKSTARLDAKDNRKTKKGNGKSKSKKDKKEKRDPFETYFDFKESLAKIPPHRVLAINRGERAKTLKVRIDADFEKINGIARNLLIPEDHSHAELLSGCVRDTLQRLVLPAMEREIRRELTERAERHAVEVFARNLRNLLLQRPVHGQRVLALDPGFKSGCQIAILDEFGNLVAQDRIFIVGKDPQIEKAKSRINELIRENQITAIAIGNGAACRQTEKLVSDLLENELANETVEYVIVNEAGASVYSTSSVGREELPEIDAKVRSAVSIGRRLLDPLSELVKISPANIGVGMYQHDVKAKHLQESLDDVVASCVNFVGVDVNTASPSLLRYVSGLNQLTARRIVEYRTQNGPIKTREQLKEVQGVGDTTFVQAAGFLRIANGDEPFDSTWIHPESYALARSVLQRVGIDDPRDFTKLANDANPKEGGISLQKLDVDSLATELATGKLLLDDIVFDLRRPGRDPREDLPAPVFRRGIVRFDDLAPGMALSGRVLNVVDFGVFVDIGLSDSGLIHISKLSDRYISDPHDVASVGDLIHVWVIDVDTARRRVSLTALDPNRRIEPSRSAKSQSRQPRGQRPKRGAGKERKPRHSGRKPVQGSRSKRHERKPAKPPKPITDAMAKGREPMRSFSDLKQFFDINKDDAEESKKS